MRVPVYKIIAFIAVLVGLARCDADPARPIEPVQLRVDGKAVELASPALYDGREVYLPLEVAAVLKCKVVMPDKEDYAIVASPKGVRREIALARLRRAPMIPLSSLASLLDVKYAVSGGFCDIRYPVAPRAEPAQPERPKSERAARQVASTSGGSTASRSGGSRAASATHGGVQPPDSIEKDPNAIGQLGSGGSSRQTAPRQGAQAGGEQTAAPVIAPVDDVPPVATTPPKTSSVRTPSWLRDIVCEAVDPAQTRLLIVADGPIRPSVRMAAAQGVLTVDLPGTAAATAQTEWTFENPLVAGARVEAGPAVGVTRVVFALRRLVTYRDRPAPPDGHEVLIRLPKLVGRRFEEMRIMVDPGHGGPSATGCSAMVGGRRIYEKDLNLAIAKKVVERLRSAGLFVTMTRATDVAVGLSERPSLANAMPADVFVSIHVDDAPGNSRASGPTAYYHGNDENGRALGLSIVEGVAAAGGLPSRGARSDMSRFRTGMAVLKRAEMPAVLIEVAYISNPGDRAKLITEEFQTRVATAIADGIRRYVEGKLPGGAPEEAVGMPAVQTPEGP